MADDMPVTLKEMSKRLGLGMSTVSEVLNNKPIRCKDSTKKRIHDLARKLNYRPNIVAKSLTNQKTMTVGLVTSSLAMDLNEIENMCWGAGYSMNVTATHLDLEKQTETLHRLRQKHVDGAILIDPLPGCDVIQSLANSGYPMVIIGYEMHYPSVTTFKIDTKGGTKQAVRHLIDLGHRRIAAIFSPGIYGSSSLRDEGWREALNEDLGIVPDDDWFVPLDAEHKHTGVYSWAYEAAQEFMRRFIKNDAGRPTAIYTSVDEVAIGAIQAFHEAGWRVPEDISIIGLMGLEIGRYCRPSITSVDIEHLTCRKEAMKYLLKRLRDDEETPKSICTEFGARLVKRQSTSEPPF
jgi:DNA-binding LacI/PurR family transcriptional regulator